MAEADKIIDSAMSAYIKKNYSLDLKYFSLNKLVKYILDKIKAPNLIEKKARSLYQRIKGVDYSASIVRLPTKYLDDFNQIRLHVLSFAEKQKKTKV